MVIEEESFSSGEDNFKCDVCRISQDTLYEFWLRHPLRNDPFIAGTATAGLIRKARLCLDCARCAMKADMLYDEARKQLEKVLEENDY